MIQRVVIVALVLATTPAVAQMTLPGKFEVTDTGSASYTIPISVVPGTAGLEPKLSLQYDSRSGNGLLGMGWSLAGLPAITRCSRTIAQDGAVGGVAFDANDRFCLDGQRLIAINSGSYGADQTEYRTERESFSKIVSYGSAGSGPAWFKVWTKAGLVMEFGNTADSRIEAQGKASVRVWAINRTSDTKGNWFSVSYTEDNANGEFRPNRIDYTGNAVANTQSTNSVRFVYEARPDIMPLYQAGSLIKTTQRMIKVQAWHGENLNYDYKITYDSTDVSRPYVSGIVRCSDLTNCTPVKAFILGPSDSGTFMPYVSDQRSSGSWAGWSLSFGDINGDGKLDQIAYHLGGSGWHTYTALGNGDGTFMPYVSDQRSSGNWTGWSLFFGDINGDGKLDQIAHHLGSGWHTYTALGNGDGTFMAYVSDQRSSGSWAGWSLFFGDVNGDGRLDQVVYYLGSSGWHTYTALGNGDGTFMPYVSDQRSSGNWTGWSLFFGDVDGDGRLDQVAYHLGSSGWHTYTALGNGDGTFMPYVSDQRSSGSWAGWSLFFGDVNGDGRLDQVVYDLGSSGWHTYTALGKGDGTFMPYVHDQRSTASWAGWSFFFGDINGDGRLDQVAYYLGSSGWHTYTALGKGDGTFMPYVHDQRSAASWAGWSFLFVDVNGDGKLDQVAYYLGGSGWHTYASMRPASSNAIAELGDSISGIKLSYASLSAMNGSYVKDAGTSACAYPCIDVQAPLYVVSEVKSSNGLGGEYRSTYRYVGAKADNHGRGFLGFRQMVVKDEQTGVEQVTSYRQDYPFTGLVGSREKKLAAQLLNRSTNSYSATDLGGTRRYPFLTSSLEESWELSGQALPAVTTSYQYDAFGNATQVGVSTGDGHSKATSNTYSNDVANWLLGRLIRSEVTSTVPGN